MISVFGYLRQDDSYLVCEDKPISVNSAGYYDFKTKDVGSLLRSQGREDYQIIYIAKGKGYFTFEQEEIAVDEGNIVLYKPHIKQQYRYEYKDQSRIYWIHFTGNDIENYLRTLNLQENLIYKVGFVEGITNLWENIIAELQVKRMYYEELTEGMLMQLLASLSRNVYEEKNNILTTHKNIQKVIEDMHRNCNREMTVNEYAKCYNMSACWFINNFKLLTGMTPRQYMIHIKINKAKALLKDSQLNVNEVAEIVGFQNAFYFSRAFKKTTGMSPKEWKEQKMAIPINKRKKIEGENE